MKTTSPVRGTRFAAITCLAMLACPVIATAEEKPAPAPAQSPTGNPGHEAIVAKMKSIMIPEVKLEDSNFEEAVDFLRTAGKANDKDGKGVQFMIALPRGTELPRVSLKLQNVSLAQVVASLADASKTSVRIDGEIVVFTPKAAAPPAGPALEAAAEAQRTTIDLIEVSDEPLDSVVEKLNQKSGEQNGPKIVIADGLDPKTKVKELRLRDATLSETLGFIAQSVKAKVTAGDSTLVLGPR